MKSILLILAFLFTATPALAVDLDSLAAQLAAPSVVRGELVQEKHLRGMVQPLTSRGWFVLARESGLLWQLQTPIQQEYRITETGISRKVDGQWQVQPKNTVAARQSRLFLAVLRGDYAGLAGDFSLKLSGTAQQWQVQLTPRSALVGKIFTRIDIHGGALVERIELHETQGDLSVLQLVNNTVADALNAHEEADFAAR